MDGQEVGETEDLATLVHLNEHILLQEIKSRYFKDKIYTYVGDILVAVNPFKPLKIYSNDVSSQYRNAKISSLPPHIFAVSDISYQAMLGQGLGQQQSQCVLISGESGAGKTESTKLIIKHLMDISGSTSQLGQQILQVNPLLEAFGNAQTLMNDNSSRFGKYIQLKFHKGQVLGAKISEYLLEKTRVVRQNPGEQCFHVFYYMLAGLTPEQLDKYQLDINANYRYLTNGLNKVKSSSPRLKSEFEDVINAMDVVGFTEQDQDNMLSVLSAVLNLGNVNFELNSDDAATVSNTGTSALKQAATLLGIDALEVVDCFTFNETVTRGEVIRRNYTAHQADDARNATTKAIYGRMFGWIVNKINQLLAPEILEKEMGEIGILDIFGFEHFEKNSFEQACINLANEQLQFFFNKHIFTMEQEEYKKEGIDWNEIKFVDNLPLLHMFVGKPVGLLSLLDEESFFPKATDHTFVEKLNKAFEKNTYYLKASNTTSNNFTIAHYAGKVTYTSDGFLEKNRDTLPPGINEMLQRSSNSLVSLIFKGTITRTGTLALQGRSRKSNTKKGRKAPVISAAKRKVTLGGQFKTSLQILMERMTHSTPHFIRCIKPNNNKAAASFEDNYVSSQLLYTGMLETTKIRREGFAVRPPFVDFVKKYKIMLCGKKLGEDKESCKKILNSAGLQGFQIGHTKIFLKYWHIESLTEIIQAMGKSAVHIQRVVRGFMGRQKARKQRVEAHKQAQQMTSFLTQIKNMSVSSYGKIQDVVRQDSNIPDEFFHPAAAVESIYNWPDPPPPPPAAISEEPTNQKKVTIATTVKDKDESDEESEDDILEDEFTPVKTTGITKYGHSGTRAASVRWFKATQSTKVQQSQGQFFEWFHGIITRHDAEILLQNKAMGCFLIRVSESRFGYSLSFRVSDRSRHYMIDMTASSKYIIVGEPKVHKTLTDLVIYHQKTPISNYPGVLTIPCGQQKGQCDYSDLIGSEAGDLYHELETPSQEDVISIYYEAGPFQPRSTRRAPPIPERNYGYTGLTVDRSSRPLPQEPRQNYESFIDNQRSQNTGKARLSTTRSRLQHPK